MVGAGGGLEEISKRTVRIFEMLKMEAEVQEIRQQLPGIILPGMKLLHSLSTV